jgi:hypothetical protein
MIFSENRLPRFKAMPATDMIAPTARGCKRGATKMHEFQAKPVVTGSLAESQYGPISDNRPPS